MGSGASAALKEKISVRLESFLEDRSKVELATETYWEYLSDRFCVGLLEKLQVPIEHPGQIANLRYIDLSYRFLGSTALAANAAVLLSVAPTCKKLNVCCTSMDGAGLVRFAQDVERHVHIQDLDFHGNDFSSRMHDEESQKKIGQAIAQIVGKMPLTQEKGSIDFSYCKLLGVSIRSVRALTKNWSPGMMPELNLAGNDFGPGEKVGAALAHVFNLCPLAKRISLARCGLDAAGMERFAQVYDEHYAIKEVDVLNNRFGAGPAPGRFLGVLLNRSPNVQKFFAFRCDLDSEALECMGRTIEQMSKLKVIDMSNDELYTRSNSFRGEKAGMGIADIMAKCPALSILDVRHCGLDTDAIEGFITQWTQELEMDQNRTLAEFRCFDSGGDDSTKIELKERLQEYFLLATFC